MATTNMEEKGLIIGFFMDVIDFIIWLLIGGREVTRSGALTVIVLISFATAVLVSREAAARAYAGQDPIPVVGFWTE
jgi:hypothetical protein